MTTDVMGMFKALLYWDRFHEKQGRKIALNFTNL